jgi:hypothetical protein
LYDFLLNILKFDNYPIKTYISNLGHNLHQDLSMSKYWKAKLYCIVTIFYYREIPGAMSVFINSPQYMSPEMIANKPYDEKVYNN